MPEDVLRDQIAAALAGRDLPPDADEVAKQVRQLREEDMAALALAHMFFEQLVEIWHNDKDSDLPLAEFCGFKDLQGYGHFLAGHWPDAVKAIA